MACNYSPVIFKGSPQLTVTASTRSRANQNHQIVTSELMLVPAKTFSHQAFYPVALYRIASIFDRHRHSQPGMLHGVGNSQDGDKTISRLDFTLPEYPLKPGCSKQAMRARILRCCCSQRSSIQTASRARPFARRALITMRPFLVRIRALKPWVRLRFKLLG